MSCLFIFGVALTMIIRRLKEPKVPPFRCGGRRPGVRRTPGPPARLGYVAISLRSCRAGPPLTGRRIACISISLKLAARGQPRTPPLRPRCQNWPSGLSGTAHSAGIPAPRPAASAAFSLYWPSGVCLATYLPGLGLRPSFYQHIELSLFFHDCVEVRQGPSPFALAA